MAFYANQFIGFNTHSRLPENKIRHTARAYQITSLPNTKSTQPGAQSLRKSHFWRTNLSRGDGCIIQARATPRPCACKFHSYAPAAGGFMPSFICTGATLCISWKGRYICIWGESERQQQQTPPGLKYCKIRHRHRRRLIRRVTFALVIHLAGQTSKTHLHGRRIDQRPPNKAIPSRKSPACEIENH